MILKSSSIVGLVMAISMDRSIIIAFALEPTLIYVRVVEKLMFLFYGNGRLKHFCESPLSTNLIE
ncbi:hypothetical protein LEP1GSC073_3256 [Leptospira noguchii str. Cascata]|nr:hypothetical protein LEP1GSC073_3256 [Leptospira noguchii str. Cascata]